MRPLLIAVQFLTRLPVRLRRPPEPREVGRSLLCYPVVGLALGLLLAVSARLVAPLPALLGAALLLVAWVAAIGTLHLDGLADTCDAWAGGRGDRARMLEILKDPRSGPVGVTALVLVLMVKLVGLGALLEAGEPRDLVYAPFLGRAALPLLFLTTPYVRPGGLGASLAAELSRRGAAAAVLVSYAAVALAGGAVGAWALLGALTAFFCLRAWMQRGIGGTTGDTAGALVELTEVSVLLVVAVVRALR